MASQDRLTDRLLTVDDLSVSYGADPVVRGVSFALDQGESLALIGESGSGKSTIARAVLRLLPEGAKATGRVQFQGNETLSLPERRFRPLRGRRIGFVPQDPANALNPVRSIGAQADEAARLLDLPSRAARRKAVLETLAEVGLDDPRHVLDAYPHELSGGMLQRVLIGLAVLPRPALLVADEPTSALDVTIQKRILDLLSRIRADRGIGLLLITHDLAVAAERTDRLVVLRGGQVQEAGPTARIFAAPASTYARKLQQDVPALNPDRHASLCDRSAPASLPPRIRVQNVTKTFATDTRRLTAVDDISFEVAPGTTHALVGESGSGKTTTIRLLTGLEAPDRGQITVAGHPVTAHDPAGLRRTWRQLQLVYQNPFTSLDPTWRIEQLVREPLDRFGIASPAERRERAAQALADVGLAPHLAQRRPAHLSAGQRQRVAIARALVLRPEVIVLDEPTSALDVSVQADIVQVLMTLQAGLGLTYVFVSHDLALVRQLAHTVSVMHRGRIVETGPTARIFDAPQHRYTRSLLDAIPQGRRAAEVA